MCGVALENRFSLFHAFSVIIHNIIWNQSTQLIFNAWKNGCAAQAVSPFPCQAPGAAQPCCRIATGRFNTKRSPSFATSVLSFDRLIAVLSPLSVRFFCVPSHTLLFVNHTIYFGGYQHKFFNLSSLFVHYFSLSLTNCLSDTAVHCINKVPAASPLLPVRITPPVFYCSRPVFHLALYKPAFSC